jgi:hypothetical protein
MTTKNILLTTTLSLFAILSIAMIPNFEAFAEEEEKSGYKMAENVKAVMTFTFRDGVEIHEFPSFSMTTDFVSNTGTTFEVKGVIGESPHLHKALDESYKYRLMIDSANGGFDYDYRFFDVDVGFLRDDIVFSSIGYYNCEILAYSAETLNSGDYESYTSSKSGFAIVDDIDFRCGGLNSNNPVDVSMYEGTFTDYTTVPLDYTFAEDVRTFVTFDFENGQERIEYHGFYINSGFGEEDDAGPEFSVERTLDYFPLLGKEIDTARKVSALPTSYNSDFNAKVEFVNGKSLRTIDYTDCRINGADIETKSDKEESFTGKSGFAIVQNIDFACAGIDTTNTGYGNMAGTTKAWKTTMTESIAPTHEYNVGQGATAMVTFTYSDGIEVINFPIFDQHNVLDKSYPTFTLEGIVGDFPMLYERVDENLSIQSVQGSSYVENFDVDVSLMYGEETARVYNYSGCRVTDYDVNSAMNKEESYIKGKFAFENTFDFECKGYTPNSPVYDALFDTTTYAKTLNTGDLRNTDSWGPGFTVQE